MEITLFPTVASASFARGLTVVIDILRAATTAAYALKQGADRIIPVATPEDARRLKRMHPEYLLMGEVHGLPIEGFDFGNSPAEIIKQDLQGKTLLQKTTAGTEGLLRATQATNLVFGSFATFSAIVRFIQSKNPPVVSIVATEKEDELFSQFLKEALEGKVPSFAEVKKAVENHPGASYFLDPKKPQFSKKDLVLSLKLDACDFVCLVERKENGLEIRKYAV